MNLSNPPKGIFASGLPGGNPSATPEKSKEHPNYQKDGVVRNLTEIVEVKRRKNLRFAGGDSLTKWTLDGLNVQKN